MEALFKNKTWASVSMFLMFFCFFKSTFALAVNLPEKNSFFVGRSGYLDKIKLFLKEAPVVLYGASGIGKTQIIKQYIHQNKSDYDVVWWINAKESLAVQVKALIKNWNNQKALAANDFLKEGLDNSFNFRQLDKALQLKKYKWMLVLDDFNNSNDTDFFVLVNIFKQKNNTDFLITTRDGNPSYDFFKPRNIKVDRFSRNESLKYLTMLPKPKINKDLNLLAQMLDDYPLSISCAFAYIKTLPINVEEYVDLYDKSSKDIKHLEQDISVHLGKNYSDHYQSNLQTSIAMTISKIKESNTNAFDLLKFIAVLDNRGISQELILKYFNWDKITYTKALNSLIKYSLIDFNDDQTVIKCHDAIHESLFLYFEISGLKETLVKASSALNSVLPNDVLLLNEFITQDNSYLRHIERMAALYEKLNLLDEGLVRLKIKQLEFVLTNDRNKQESTSLVRDIAKMLNSVRVSAAVKIRFLLMQSTFSDWMLSDDELSILQAKEAEKIINKNNHLILDQEKLMLSARLAQIYSFQGDYKKALEYISQGEYVIAKHQRVSVGFQVILYQSKSLAYYHDGNFKKSLEVIEEAINLMPERIKNYDKGDTFGIIFLLNKYKIMIKLDLAIEALKEINIMESKIKEFYGDDHFLLDKLNPIKAEGLISVSNLDEANKYLDMVLPYIDKQDIKQENISSLASAKTLKLKGDILNHQGNYLDADKYFKYADNLYDKYLNFKEIHDVSELYLAIVFNKLDMNDVHGASTYRIKHNKIFGANHPGAFKMEFYFISKLNKNN